MKKSTLLAGAALAATALTLIPAAAHASTAWPGDIDSKDYVWTTRPTIDFNGATDINQDFSSMLYKSGTLVFDDGNGGTEQADTWCADPIDAPGGVTTDGADTIITCAPYVIGSGQPGEGLTGTVETRILHDLNIARVVYRIDNTTNADVVIPIVSIDNVWEESVNFGKTSSGVGSAGGGPFYMGDQDSWVVVDENSSYIPSAVAWGNSCLPTYDLNGSNVDDIWVTSTAPTTFATGTSTYYAVYIEMETPLAHTDDAVRAAVDTLATRMASRYAYLTPDLLVGIPTNDIEFWDPACNPAPNPDPTPDAALPNTGSSDALVGYAIAGASCLVLFGTILVFLRRRTVK